jgi:hypothetical protein
MGQRFRQFALTACLLLGAVQPVLAADAPALDVQTWRIVPGLQDGWLVRSARPMAPDAWTTFADLSYTRAPLRFSADVGGVTQRQTVIGDLGMLQLGGAMGLQGGWTLGAVLPMAGVIRGGGPDLTQVPAANAPAFGDLRLEVRKAFLHSQQPGMTTDLAGAVVLGLPTAAKNVWLGGTTSVGLEVLGSLRAGQWLADADVGVRMQSTQTMEIAGDTLLRAGSTFVLRAAATRGLLEGVVRTRAELQVLAPIVTVVPAGQTVVDLAIGGDVACTDALRIYAMFGGAPTSGPGSAGFRAAIGLRLDPQQLPHDTDGDGLDDRVDKCPNQAEDKDGFEDQDGCPDPDNDGDGIPDLKDKCPNAPEDVDGVQDEDGCPDPDNDGDGIPDVKDKCPNQAEDLDGFDDDDGCPEGDNDLDGIPDVHDLCPLSPETKNGFEDEDGCPDIPPGQAKPKEWPVPAPVVAPTPAPAPAAPAAAKPAHGKGKVVTPVPKKAKAAAPAPAQDAKPRAKLKPL